MIPLVVNLFNLEHALQGIPHFHDALVNLVALKAEIQLELGHDAEDRQRCTPDMPRQEGQVHLLDLRAPLMREAVENEIRSRGNLADVARRSSRVTARNIAATAYV